MKKRRKKLIKTEKEDIRESDMVKKIKIRVIGIGDGAGNIVSEIAQRVKRASFFAANTDSKSLKSLSRKVARFQFGQSLTQGLGTGMDPEIGERAAINEKEKIKKLLEGQDFVILISSLGGGTGSGASPIFAKISNNLGNLTYGIFTLPFRFEGKKKMEIAKSALKKLETRLNAFTLLQNEKIFQLIDRKTPLKKALSIINRNLADNIQSLIEIIYQAGLINIDFADLRTVFDGRGRLTYFNSVDIDGNGTKEATDKIINFPLYSYSIEGAKGVLLNISGQKRLSLAQVSQVSQNISNLVDKEAKIIFGISGGKTDSKIRVNLLATGCKKEIFPEKSKKILKGLKSQLKEKIKSKKTELKKKGKVEAPHEPEIEEVEKTPLFKFPDFGTTVRKNALQVKKDVEKEESEITAKERFWETPAFLRKKSNKPR